jgi:hypothetical protein
MAAEDHNRGRSPSDNRTQVDHSLDNVARGLASGTISRREAVRLMGAALLGGALASVPGLARAAPRGNSACADYCTQAFPPGAQRGQRISQGAQGSGPCYECNVDLGVSPPVGPHFQCPPGSVIDTDPQFENCCHNCADTGAVLCGTDPEVGCYSLEYRCGDGGTFDPSTCSCICPAGTINCENSNGTPGRCVDPQSDRQHCGQCANSCFAVSQTAVCVNGVCVEPT